MNRKLLILSLIFFTAPTFVFSKNNTQDATKLINPNVFRIVVSSGSYTDEAVIGFFAAAQDIFESYDSGKMFSPDANYPQTYCTTSDNVDVAIDGVPLLTSTIEKIIPLCFRAQVAGTFTFQATNLADFDSNISVYLEDVQLNVMQDLRISDSYTFTSGVINTKTRFKLHFVTPNSVHLLNWLGTFSNDWNIASNWNTNAIPTSNDNIYISSLATTQPHITNMPASPSVCNTLTIYSGASLTIDAGKALTATGTTTLNGAQCLIINSEGSFIDNGFAGAGTARVEKSLLQNRWYYAGLPLSTSVAASSFGTISTVANTNTHLYYWNEAGQAYTQIPNGSTTINPGPLRGYSVKDYSNPISAAFIGTLNTGTVANASLTYTSGTTAGYNLVCNPYPSAIDLGTWNGSNATTSTGVTVANLETSIWYRTNSTFSTYNWTSGTGQGSPAGQSKVPAMQAFWVRTISSTTGSLQFNNSVRLHNAQAFYKTAAETNVFRMNVSDGTNTDEAVVGFYQDAQNAFENFDSEKMMVVDDIPQLYSLTGDSTEVAINGQPDLTASEERIIPLGFSTNVAGTFTLNATNLADFNPSVSVYLEDLQQSVLQDLRQNNLYNFTSGVVNSTSRFKLHFAYMLTSLSTELAPAALVYADDNEIYVNSPSASTVEVFNALGKKVSDGKAEKGLNKFPLNTAKGFYIVKVQTGSAIVTKKVFAGK
jgi:hypothetical protein